MKLPPPQPSCSSERPLVCILWFVMVIVRCLLLFLFQGEGFDVMKSGDARVALIGFPSVGKVHQLIWYNDFRINVYEWMIHCQDWQICSIFKISWILTYCLIHKQSFPTLLVNDFTIHLQVLYNIFICNTYMFIIWKT